LPRQKENPLSEYFGRSIPFHKNYTLYYIITLQHRIQNLKRTMIVVLTENITHMGSRSMGVSTSNNFLIIDISIVLELVSLLPI